MHVLPGSGTEFDHCPAIDTQYQREGMILARTLVSGRSAKFCRARQDVTDSVEIRCVYDESRGRYGARKVWHQLRRENKDIGRCTVERLMKVMGLQGPSRQNCRVIRLPGGGCLESGDLSAQL